MTPGGGGGGGADFLSWLAAAAVSPVAARCFVRNYAAILRQQVHSETPGPDDVAGALRGRLGGDHAAAEGVDGRAGVAAYVALTKETPG